MRVSDTEAAQRVADNDNLVGELVEAASAALNYIENTECELGIKLSSGDKLRAVLAKAKGPTSPRFANVFCSQCGGEFGPGDHGYSHCKDHRKAQGAQQ